MPARVLVVDDSAVVRQALAQILGRAGVHRPAVLSRIAPALLDWWRCPPGARRAR